MGKKSKNNAGPKRNAGGHDDSDDGSTIEESTEEGLLTPVRTKKQNPSHIDVSEAVEKLSEKRFTTRENGLEKLIKHFQTSYDAPGDLSVEGYQDTIRTQLLRCIRRPPSIKEGILSMQLTNLLGLYFGPDEDEFLHQSEKLLRHVVTGHGVELHDLRAPALSCLAFLTFICGGVDAGYRTWAYCGRILRGEDSQVAMEEVDSDDDDTFSDTSDSTSSADQSRDTDAQRAALRAAAATGWVLLATLRTPEEVLESCAGDGEACSLLEPLLELLEYRDSANAGAIDIKIAAGKCVAYLWETAAGAVGPAATPEEAGQLLCRDASVVDRILTFVKQTGKDSSKRTSKKDRKEQRGEFRAVEDLIFKGEGPDESMRMQGAMLELSTYKDLAVVDALKAVLGSGFHSSLRLYPVVKDVLGVEYLTSDMDGAGHDLKVGKGSSADKSRSNYRKQDRRFRSANTDFVGGDFGDFDD